MTQIIDEKGRLFGLVNIIDAMVVQLLAAVGAAGVAYSSPEWTAVAAVVFVAGDIGLLAYLAFADDSDSDSESVEDDREAIEDGDLQDDAQVGVLELPTGERYEVVPESGETVRADGGEET